MTLKRRIRSAVLAALTLLSTLAFLAAPTAGAAGDQFTFFDGQLTHDWNRYAAITSWGGPSNWRSPVDYANGRMYWRLQILSKPSSKPVDVQLCVWRNNYTEETCSGLTRFTDEGTYWIDLGRPLGWWKKGGSFSWSTPWDVTRIMLKDAATQRLLLTRSCGAHCYLGSDINDHVPIQLDASIVVVGPGSTLIPPLDWTGCPSTWSLACTGSSSSSVTTATTSSTSTTSSSTSSTVSTTPPPPPPPASDVVMISGTTGPPSGDRPVEDRLEALGHRVTVVDDDALTPAALTGADLVLLMSSVVPSKVPAWLGDITTPLMANESYALATLGLAVNGADTAGQTRLDVVPGHPIAGGLGGSTVVSNTQPFAAGSPGSGAATIATLPGNGRAGVFAYDTGDATVDGPAEARRVGFFLAYPTSTGLNDNGWALFEQSVAWLLAGGTTTTTTTAATTTTTAATTTTTAATTTTTAATTTTTPPSGGTTAVMVAGNSTPPSGDRPLRDRLESLGWTVQVVDDDALTPASLNGADLILVMSSVLPSKVPEWLGDVAVPLLSNESYAAPTLRLGTSGADSGGRTQLVISGGHPVAAGLSGTVTVSSSATHAYISPAAGGTVVATDSSTGTVAGIVAYDTASALTSGTAPARRVAFFQAYDAPARTNADGWALFDAAIDWLDG